MEKEKVLEIEFKEVFDKIAIRIKYQNFEVLKRGEFYDGERKVESDWAPAYIKDNNKLYIQGKDESEDSRIFLVDKEDLKNILEKVNKINEKYGIPKRWRAKIGDCYYSISQRNLVFCSKEEERMLDTDLYNLGNYFKTEEEAERVILELDKFWAKVRVGEIGGEND
ncbi:hypothetical protein [Fusobacterium vincentii ATCC 49256]|uniref:Uncharacterized protein n=1 Tax=Fusobacterium vincentii ATCC 49256 TaxID=209882 RepID=Q7P5U2_FUSVC|nr:hypothetical protein [Fusobacterium vincentii ATCC 49256]